MKAGHNKNKRKIPWKITGLAVAMASFLLLPAVMVAQSANSNANGNSNTAINTNSTPASTNSNTNSSDPALGNQNTNTDTSIVPENASLQTLNQEIDARRKAIEELQKTANTYQQGIRAKQQEAISLQNQLALIDLQVNQTENDIQIVQQEIEKVKLEIDGVNAAIDAKEAELEYARTVLGEYLRLINKYDQKSSLEVIMANGSFSDFYDQLQYTQNLQSNIQDSLLKVKDAKESLENEKAQKEDKKKELDDLSTKLSTSIVNLNDQKVFKIELLDQTKQKEEKFTELLEAAQKEQQAAEAEVGTLESQAREKLTKEGVDLNIDAALMWPVSPDKGVSAYFHDPSYIFRKYFEHPAVDIRASQGTAIRAAGNGYVVRAKNAGMGYSYVMIVHNDKLSTVYGHMSRIDVSEDDYVVRGQQIGQVGGTPGTPGAGRLTTGPHLHFEVRSDGIPVNPLDYLPSI